MNKNRFGLCLILAALHTIASGCGEGSSSPPPDTLVPNILIADSTLPFDDHQLTFGNIQQGHSSDQTVTITNTGTENLVIGTIALANPAPFSITTDTCSGQSITPSGTCTITVRFAPSTANSFNGNFDIPSNDPDTPTVTITATGIGSALPVPDIVVNDSVIPNNDLQIPFGNIAAGNASDRIVTIMNAGTGHLVMQKVANTNPLAAPFSIAADTCSDQTIAPSGTCTVTVRFAPSTINSFKDSFDIPNNDPDTPSIVVSVQGINAPQMGGAIQGHELALMNTVSTVAGRSPVGSDDGIGSQAKFQIPTAAVSVGTNLYVSDTLNHTIRQINIITAVVSTFAGKPGFMGTVDGTGADARLYYPRGIATDGMNLYVAEPVSNTIRQINIATRVVTTLAGSPGICGSDDGIGTAARFCGPVDMTTDGTNLYVTDSNNQTIRQINISTRNVTTLAGTAGLFGSANGTGSNARFNSPQGITTDGANLYVTEWVNTIRQINISTCVVTTLAGQSGSIGSDDGIGAAARFNDPRGITTDGANLYVADSLNNTIRQINLSTRAVTTFAGTAGSSGTTDDVGSNARFNNPTGIVRDGQDLYVTDTGNSTIRKIPISSGSVETFAAKVDSIGIADGSGTNSRFNNPSSITTDGTNLYIADSNNHTIRQIDISTSAVTTLAGMAGLSGSNNGTGTAAQFFNPSGITTDGINLYVADTNNHTIRQINISTGVVTTFAGAAGSRGFADGTGAAARFTYPTGITTDGTNLYVADKDNHIIRQIVISSGVVTTLAGTRGYVGFADGTGPAAQFYWPSGITTDGTNLYVTEEYNCTIRKIEISTGAVTTLAGRAHLRGSTDGTGSAALFDLPQGITTDGTNLYVAEAWNHVIRKIVVSTGAVTTLSGVADSTGSTDGTGPAVRFNYPRGITTDGVSLYVADTVNNTIRRIQ